MIFLDAHTRTPIDTPIDSLSSPALAHLWIRVHEGKPTRWLTSILSSITLAPVLSPIQIQHGACDGYDPRPDKWNDMNRWLAQIA